MSEQVRLLLWVGGKYDQQMGSAEYVGEYPTVEAAKDAAQAHDTLYSVYKEAEIAALHPDGRLVPIWKGQNYDEEGATHPMEWWETDEQGYDKRLPWEAP